MVGFEFQIVKHCYGTQPPPCRDSDSYLLSTPFPVLPSSAPALLEYSLDRLSINGCNKQCAIDTPHANQSKSKPTLPISDHVQNIVEDEISFSPLSDKGCDHETEVLENNVTNVCKNNQSQRAKIIDGYESLTIVALVENQKRSPSSDDNINNNHYKHPNEAQTKVEVFTNAETERVQKHDNNKDMENCIELPLARNVIETSLDFDNSPPHHGICMSPKTCSQNSNSSYCIAENQRSNSNQEGDVLSSGITHRESSKVLELEQVEVDNHIEISQNTSSKNNHSLCTDKNALDGDKTDSNVIKSIITAGKEVVNEHPANHSHMENNSTGEIHKCNSNSNDDIFMSPKMYSQNSNSLFGENESPLSDRVSEKQRSNSNQEDIDLEGDVLFGGIAHKESRKVIGLEQVGLDNRYKISQNASSKEKHSLCTDKNALDNDKTDSNGLKSIIAAGKEIVNEHPANNSHKKNNSTGEIQKCNSNLFDDCRVFNDNDIEIQHKGHVNICERNEEYDVKNAQKNYFDSVLNIKEEDCDQIISDESTNNIPCEQFNHVAMVEPSLQSERNEGHKVTSFENTQTCGMSISTPSPSGQPCNRNELSKFEENSIPRHNKSKSETDEDLCLGTKNDIPVPRNERNANEVGDYDNANDNNHKSGTRSAEYVENTNTQFRVVTPEILSSQKSEIESHLVSAPKSIEQELTFSPLYTQDCNDQEEIFNHCDSKKYSSPLSSKFMKFSPLINSQTAFSQRIFTSKVDSSIGGVELQSGWIFHRTESEQNDQILMQCSPSQLENISQTSVIHGEHSKTDTKCVNNRDETMNKEIKNLIKNVGPSSTNIVSDNHSSYSERSTLVVFSPLVESCPLNNHTITDFNDLNSSQKEQCNFSDVAIQIVPNCETKCIKNTCRTIDNDNNCFVKQNTDASASIHAIGTRQMRGAGIALELEDNHSCHTGSKQDLIKEKCAGRRDCFEKNDSENEPADEKNILEAQKEDGVLDETVSRNVLHRDINDMNQQNVSPKESKQNNSNFQCNIIGEQMVPVNCLVKDHEGCHNEASFYDVDSMEVGESKSGAMRPYHSSFQWQSVYESVLVNNGNGNVQTTAVSRDHLESITPLPSPMKRPRPLRVGLSKKQKVNHLHGK